MSRSDTLSRLDSALSETFAKIELKFRQLVNIRVSTKIEHPAFKAISFGKHDGRWCFLLEGPKEDAGDTPLTSAGRVDRLQCIEDGWIDALIDAVDATLDSEIRRRHDAVIKLSATFQRLETKTNAEAKE